MLKFRYLKVITRYSRLQVVHKKTQYCSRRVDQIVFFDQRGSFENLQFEIAFVQAKTGRNKFIVSVGEYIGKLHGIRVAVHSGNRVIICIKPFVIP